MRTTTVGCDRCRRVIEADMATVQCLGILKDTVGQADSCGPCAADSLEWLGRGTAPEEMPPSSRMALDASASID
jgi:hypothetical protein